jgi:RNA polymerase sigma-70 factor (ECF subfamily)
VDSDRELVRRVKAGDRTGFDRLVRRYESKVYRLAFGILKNSLDAEDALQESFIRAYRAIGSFREESTFSTWLYRITANVCLGKTRGKKHEFLSIERHDADGGDGLTHDFPSREKTPLEELLSRETERVVQDCIDRLPEKLRTVFLLRDLEGLSREEVAATLRLTPGAVSSRLHRARLKLRARIDRYFRGRMGAAAA